MKSKKRTGEFKEDPRQSERSSRIDRLAVQNYSHTARISSSNLKGGNKKHRIE